MSALPALDRAVFARLREDVGGDDAVAELLDSFLGEAPGLIAAMRSAADAGDANGLARAAHQLKSTSASFGAAALASHCAAAEQSARAGRLPEAAQQAAQAAAAFGAVQGPLRDAVHGPPR